MRFALPSKKKSWRLITFHHSIDCIRNLEAVFSSCMRFAVSSKRSLDSRLLCIILSTPFAISKLCLVAACVLLCLPKEVLTADNFSSYYWLRSPSRIIHDFCSVSSEGNVDSRSGFIDRLRLFQKKSWQQITLPCAPSIQPPRSSSLQKLSACEGMK